jgi:adenylate cyclase
MLEKASNQVGSLMASTRRLAAVLAADVAGYSRLMGADEEGTHESLKVHFEQLINPTIGAHHGRLVKTTGDGLLVEFASVVDAVRCAVEMQRGMAERNVAVSAPDRIEFRMGINVGDIIIEDGDIFGDGVNIAARLEALAEPGGICLSAAAHEQVRDRLDIVFDDRGEQQVKNIARPVRVLAIRTASEVTKSQVAAPPPPPLPDKPSIAVLPFQNISGDPEQEIFADGMVEDITTALSKIRWFFVIARNSSFTYKGHAVDVKQVGRELGVRYVLEGSVRKSSNRLRITAQLIEAATGNHVWAERYDRDISDIFALQDEITERVVAAIEPELYAAENIRSQRKPPDSLDAWECVIRALSAFSQGTREGTAEAEQLCRRAIAIAPDYGQAHSLLAWALVRRSIWTGDFQNVVPEIAAETQAALALDDRDPWAYLAQGHLFLRLRRFDDSERAFRRTLELNPNFALGHAALGTPLANQGHHREAIDCAENALRLSPNDRNVGFQAFFVLTIAHFASEQYGESVSFARSAIEKAPGHIGAHMIMTAALALQGNLTAAIEARNSLFRIRPEFSLAWMSENLPPSGDLKERLQGALRKAGVPEA